MSPDHRTDEVINSVLQALSQTCSDAWCFVRYDPREITHCSAEFLRLFSIENRSSSDGARALSVSSTQLSTGCRALGVKEDLFQRVFPRLLQPDTPLVAIDEYEDISVTRRLVRDERNNVLGCLVLFSTTGGAGIMQAAWTRAREAKQTLAVLSAREAQVLDLVSQGLTNKAVAARAGISEKTVEKHRSKIMRKLNVKSAAELMERVTHAKLLD